MHCRLVYGVGMSDWRESRPLAYVILAVIVTLQLAIPLSRVGTDERRFGWKMFSLEGTPLGLVVETTNGSEIEIDPDEYMAMVRADVDILALLPPHLCLVVPDAATVTWEGGSLEC